MTATEQGRLIFTEQRERLLSELRLKYNLNDSVMWTLSGVGGL